MVFAPGHSPGLAATLVCGTETVVGVKPGVIGDDLRKYILLTSNVGFGRPSFEERLRPGVVTDAKAAFHSLDWARAPVPIRDVSLCTLTTTRKLRREPEFLRKLRVDNN